MRETASGDASACAAPPRVGSSSDISRSDARLVPYLVLTLLLGLGVAMLYLAPVRRYVVACERTERTTCVLERTGATRSYRTSVPLDEGASAVVRVVPQRRGGARVLLDLDTPARSVFAAEFEGEDASAAASQAAARLNRVLRGTGPASARVETVPPPLLRWLAWGGLGVMGLLILAGCRDVRRAAAS